MARKVLGLMLGLAVAVSAVGCRSPYHADRGALGGGLIGAGAGAIIGDRLGSAGAGTAIGAGLGALTGAAIGSELDDIEARNQANLAAIEQQLGRQVAAGAVTINDVISMTRAGVDDELIVNHVRARGTASPLETSDLIHLQQQGVSKRVIAAMQSPPPRPPVVVRQPAAPPVVVQEYHYGPPLWGPPRCRRPHYCRPRPGVSWGMSVHN